MSLNLNGKTAAALAIVGGLTALSLMSPVSAAGKPGFMTCQIYDGARNRVFYSMEPIFAGSDDTDEAYETYLHAVQQSGMIGDLAKAQGNCNWEAGRADAAQKLKGFVEHFTSAGANPFADRFLSDPYQSKKAAADAPAAPTSTPKRDQTCIVSVTSGVGEMQARTVVKSGKLESEDLVFIGKMMEGPGQGALAGSKVYVVLNTKTTTGAEEPIFNGIGVALIFPDHNFKGRMDIEVKAGATSVQRSGISPTPSGNYIMQELGYGPLKGNGFADALAKDGEVSVRAYESGHYDQPFLFSTFSMGSPDDRDALGQRAMDAVEQKGKGACND